MVQLLPIHHFYHLFI